MASNEKLEETNEELNLKTSPLDEAKAGIELTSDSSDSQIAIKEDSESIPRFSSDFEVVKLIGKGGMGRVFEVKDLANDRVIAVKVLNASLTNDKAALKRFEQEAKSASGLKHPNLGATYDYGTTEDGEPYIVLDYYEGKSLSQIIEEEGILAPERAIELLVQICSGLKYAHLQGVVHRDLKPTNIIVSKLPDGSEVARIVDFGIAKVMPQENRETHNLTETGEVFGSPNYMSPEQCLGFMLDERSDIYSLGCLMYEMLTGDPPFAGSNPIQVVVKHINDEVEAFPDKAAKKLEGITLRCLEKDQSNRYQSVEELLKDLSLVSEGKQPSKYKRATKQKREFTKRQLVGTVVGIAALVFYGGISAAFFKQSYLIIFMAFAMANFLVIGGVYVGLGSFWDQFTKGSKLKKMELEWWIQSLSLSFGLTCLTVAPVSLIGTVAYYFHKYIPFESIPYPKWIIDLCFADLYLHGGSLLVALISLVGVLIFRRRSQRSFFAYGFQFLAIAATLVISITMLFPIKLSEACFQFAKFSSYSSLVVSNTFANIAYQLDKPSLRKTYLAAETLIRVGDYDRALSLLDGLKSYQQNDKRTLTLRVLAYRKKGDYSSALREVSKARQSRASRRLNAQLANMKGQIYEDQNNFEAALKAYNIAWQENPNYDDYVVSKVRILCSLGRYDDALKLASEVRPAGNNQRILFFKGLLLERKKDMIGAQKAYRASARYKSTWKVPGYDYNTMIFTRDKSGLSRLLHAYCNTKIGNDLEAVKDFNRALPWQKAELENSAFFKHTGFTPDWTKLQ